MTDLQSPPEPPPPETGAEPALPWYRHPLALLAAGLTVGGLAMAVIIIAFTGDDTPATTTVATTIAEESTTTAPATTLEAAATTTPTTTLEAAATTQAPATTAIPATTAPEPGAEQWIGVEFAGDLPGGLYSRVGICLGDPICAYALQIVSTEETIPNPSPDIPLEIQVWLTKNVGSQGGDTLWRVVDAEEYTFSEPGIALAVMDCYEGDYGGQPALGIMEHPVYMEIYAVVAADLTTETLGVGSGMGYVCSGGG